MIRVLVVDDFDSTRRTLARYLRTCGDMEVIGEATNGVEALEMCSTTQPHVVLMDIEMPKMRGTEATLHISRMFPNISVVGLSGFDDDTIITNMLQAGAVECVSKMESLSKVATALRRAAKFHP
jgi:DNA-binding NarL/FixJ family response regulator